MDGAQSCRGTARKGCEVIAVCGGPEKCEFITSLGVARVIDYRARSVSEVLKAEYPDRINVAIDTVGGEIFDAFLDNVAPLGRVVVGGAARDLGERPERVKRPRIAHKIYYKGASVRGFMNGLLSDHWSIAREELFELYRRGELQVHLDTADFRGLDGVFDAVEHLLSGRSMGKMMVTLG